MSWEQESRRTPLPGTQGLPAYVRPPTDTGVPPNRPVTGRFDAPFPPGSETCQSTGDLAFLSRRQDVS